MSKLYYDHLVKLKKVEREIKKIATTEEEKEELYKLVDEIVHHRVMGCVLTHLPKEHHKEFLEEFVKRPHDENLIVYLKNKIQADIEEFIKKEIHLLAGELLGIIYQKTDPAK